MKTLKEKELDAKAEALANELMTAVKSMEATMKTKKEVYRICGKEVTKRVWDKNLAYTMPAAQHTPEKSIPWELLEALKALYDATPTTFQTSKALLLANKAISKAEGKL